ncbi:hypothetical protein [Sandaracinus amylolyticus]|uniref:hypothetical protein n=1 Tax=Sandaracinus amylolyticus TaxID=927083 RepID=UPI001F43D119|nr:hypothetical protein [Sandaracinus amylolyticus]UJR82681.1 Hypothetical protein I5071_47460 [Sandaracinus amylolyticus]
MIVVVALLDCGVVGATLAHGLLDLPRTSAIGWIVVIGLCSQATGIFGALVLLDARENTFSVPVNRASSILAGVLATALLAWLLGGATPDRGELIGAALVVLAIVVLALGPRLDRRRA